MNFFQKLFKKKSITNATRYTYYGSSLFNTDNELTDLDFIRSTAYKASDLRAKAMTTLYFYAGIETDTNIEKLPDDHVINKTLNNPFQDQTLSDLLLLTVQSLDFKGNSIYLPIYSDLTGQLIGLEFIPWNRVRIDNISGVTFYSFNTGDGSYTRRYMASEVLHIKNLSTLSKSNNTLDPKVLTVGVASVENCVKDIEAEIAYKKFVSSLFKNNGVAPLILKGTDVDAPVDETTKKEYVDYLRSVVSPERILGFMPDNTEAIELAGTKTAANSNILNGDEYKRNIAEAFHVPYSKMTGQYDNRATANVVNQQFYTDSIFPTANIITEAMTMFFRKQLNEPRLRITYDKPDFLSDDLTGLQNLYLAGVIDRTEIREKLGFSAEL